MKVNRNYDNLKESYLFYTISEKVKEFRQKIPTRISYGWG